LRLSEPLLVIFARQLGIELPRMSHRDVDAILRRWIAMRYHGAADTPPGMARVGGHEPDWMGWCATVGCKVERCPKDKQANRFTTQNISAVEVVYAAEAELDDVDRMIRSRRMFIGYSLEEERERQRMCRLLHAIRERAPFNDGMYLLGRLFGKAQRDDPSFAWALK
jgi:hypothetical protein